jgi:hypothetical protein
VLEEIIVVDDASTPPMVERLQDVPSHCKLKVLRCFGLILMPQLHVLTMYSTCTQDISG